MQSGLLIQLLPLKKTGNIWSRSKYTPNLRVKDLHYSMTFCCFQSCRRILEQYREKKARGSAFSRMCLAKDAENRTGSGLDTHSSPTDDYELYQREEVVGRRNPDAGEGTEML